MMDSNWFFKDRFGLFVHWGIYALEAWHEQVQQRHGIPRDAYAKLAGRFNPTAFNPDAWIDLMEEVGMRYIVLTTKHHDGFCLWDSQLTDFKVTNTPYGKDIVAELAEACHRRGITLGLYYSIADWKHPNYPNEGRHHELPPQAGDEPDMEKYVEYLKGQVRELLTRYGDIGVIWWDMNVPKHVDPSVHAMIRELQPNCMINARGFQDRSDPEAAQRENLIITAEREYQQAIAHLSTSFDRFTQPVEACNSVDALSWGWKEDGDLYTVRHLQTAMARVMIRGGNYLLNVGPDAMGAIPPSHAELLRELGGWFGRVREALIDVEPVQHLVETPRALISRRGNDLFVVLHEPLMTNAIRLKPIDQQPVETTLLNTGESLEPRVDLIPSDVSRPYLRVRGLPVHAMADQVPVIRLRFDHLPDHVDSSTVNEEAI